MDMVDIGSLATQSSMVLSTVIVWLLVCRIIPVLRRRPGVCHAIAAVLAMAACLALLDAPIFFRLLAGLFVVAVLYRSWKRTLRKRSMEANTIIRYEDQKFF